LNVWARKRNRLVAYAAVLLLVGWLGSSPPVFDTVAWCGLLVLSPVFLPDLNRIAPIECADAIPLATPVLILAASADKHARPDEARDICTRMGNHAELVFFAYAAHDRLVETHPDQWATVVVQFLGKVPPTPRGNR